jgi:hypothetical protein
MSIQIPLSRIGDAASFKARVEAFRQAKLDHHTTLGVPAPREDELVEAAVRRVPRGLSGLARPPDGATKPVQDNAADDYAIDYEIVDDRPSLRSRKDALIQEVGRQEHALMVASMPPGKRRLDELTAGDLLRKPEAERSDAERKFLADRDARHAREAAIQRHAAVLMSEIEDLGEDTIGGWQPAPFPSMGLLPNPPPQAGEAIEIENGAARDPLLRLRGRDGEGGGEAAAIGETATSEAAQ